LEAALRQSEDPTIVVLDAADLNVGAVDPFLELIPMARRREPGTLDGAFGLWARASARTAAWVRESNGLILGHRRSQVAQHAEGLGIAIVADPRRTRRRWQ